jgi:trehalose 6-phosphate synthase/phosphatase
MAQVLIVSNRLPITVSKVDGHLTYETSIGGLSNGLSGYASGRGNLWIGWPGLASDDLTEADKQAITRRLARSHCMPVFLTQRQIDDFYTGYSNGLVWPLLHSMKSGPDEHHERWWKSYRDVNKLFARTIVESAEHDATIWVHDYQLMLVPEYVERELPHNHIGFFLHTPFPTLKILQKLPEAKRLVGSLLQADLVGLQTKVNVENFSATVEGFDFGVVDDGLLIQRGRSVQITDFPIGIDYAKFDKAYQLPDVRKAVRRMRAKYAGLKIIAGVDRLDITKGFVERLKAYQKFLQQNPKQRKKVVFVLVGAPSRGDVPAYKKLARDVEKMVAEINHQFGTKTWQPVDYIKGLPFHDVSALFQIADVGFVTPRKDGMNLVAKEFIASKRKSGVLILSEGAGAAEELRDALLVNLDQPETLVAALEQALAMRKIDITGRFDAMNEIVANHTIHGWAKDFMGALKKPIPLPVLPLTASTSRKLAAEYHRADRRAFFLDYDGALADIELRPEDAKPTAAVLKTLQKLAVNAKNDIFVISGRSRVDMTEWLGSAGVGLVAEHGAFIRKPGSKRWQATAAADISWKKELRPLLKFYAKETPGAHVEEKSAGMVWHYRESPPYQANKNMVLLRKELKPLLQQFELRAHSGKKIVEIKHKDMDKGTAVRRFLAEQRYDFILVAGDDYTDENMFKASPTWAYTIKVDGGLTDARFRVRNVAALVSLLAKLAG